MKSSTLYLAAGLSFAACPAFSQSMSLPNGVTSEQAVKMCAFLTNGMPEQVAVKLLAEQGLKCNWCVSSAALQSRTYHYNLTNASGTLRVGVKPKSAVSTNEWYGHARTNGFVST